MPQSASRTQNMDILLHLKAQVSHSTRQDQIEKRTATIPGAKVDGTNASCRWDTGVAWTGTHSVTSTVTSAFSPLPLTSPFPGRATPMSAKDRRRATFAGRHPPAFGLMGGPPAASVRPQRPSNRSAPARNCHPTALPTAGNRCTRQERPPNGIGNRR